MISEIVFYIERALEELAKENETEAKGYMEDALVEANKLADEQEEKEKQAKIIKVGN